MSVRWMAVQYLGSILRLPIVNASDMDKPFGESVLERDVKRIIINPFSESRHTFVPEEESVKLREENAKLRESVRNLLTCVKHEECEESCPNYEPMYTTYGYEKNGSIVVEDEYLGCCLAGLENCNSMLFDTDEYLRELGIEVTS